MKVGFLSMLLLVGMFLTSLGGVGEHSLFSIPSALAASDSAKDEAADKDKDKDSDSDEHKVTLCHFPPGNPESPETLSVAESAVDAHLAHGDYLGQCPCACPPGISSCVCADGKEGLPTPASTAPSPSSQRSILGK